MTTGIQEVTAEIDTPAPPPDFFHRLNKQDITCYLVTLRGGCQLLLPSASCFPLFTVFMLSYANRAVALHLMDNQSSSLVLRISVFFKISNYALNKHVFLRDRIVLFVVFFFFYETR